MEDSAFSKDAPPSTRRRLSQVDEADAVCAARALVAAATALQARQRGRTTRRAPPLALPPPQRPPPPPAPLAAPPLQGCPTQPPPPPPPPLSSADAASVTEPHELRHAEPHADPWDGYVFPERLPSWAEMRPREALAETPAHCGRCLDFSVVTERYGGLCFLCAASPWEMYPGERLIRRNS